MPAVMSFAKLLGAAAFFGAVYAADSSLPTVDLGYEIYRAANFNVSSSIVAERRKT
jgi:hypothetical protein